MELLKDWISNIVTLVIFIVLIEMLLPSGNLKKFVSLVSGFIIMLAIIQPLLGMVKGELQLKEFQAANSNFIDQKTIAANSKILEEKQMKQITETYRKKVIRQIEDSTLQVKGITSAQADVMINEDYNSPQFGEIRRILLTVETGDATSGIKPVTRVEKVQVNGEEKAAPQENVDPKLHKDVEDKLSRVFGIDKDNIVVSTLNQENI